MGSQAKRRNGKLSAAGLWLLAAAVFCRALVPLGFMPNQGGAAGEFIVICSAGVIKTLRIEAEGGAPGPISPSAEDPCPFRVLANGGLDVARSAEVWGPTAYQRLAYVRRDSVASARVSWQIRRPRGPPLQA